MKDTRFPTTTSFCKSISIPLATGGWTAVPTLDIKRIRSHWWQLPWGYHTITISQHRYSSIIITLPSRFAANELRKTWKFALKMLEKQQ